MILLKLNNIFFSETHFKCRHFSSLEKSVVCQEVSTKLGTLHGAAVWKMMIAHNNQPASGRTVSLQLGEKGEDGDGKEALYCQLRSCCKYIDNMVSCSAIQS